MDTIHRVSQEPPVAPPVVVSAPTITEVATPALAPPVAKTSPPVPAPLLKNPEGGPVNVYEKTWPEELKPAIQALVRVLPTGVTVGAWHGKDSPDGVILEFLAAGGGQLSVAALDRLVSRSDPTAQAVIRRQYQYLKDGIKAYYTQPPQQSKTPRTVTIDQIISPQVSKLLGNEVTRPDQATPPAEPVKVAETSQAAEAPPDLIRQRLDANIQELERLIPGLTISDLTYREPDPKHPDPKQRNVPHTTLNLIWTGPDGRTVDITKPEDFAKLPAESSQAAIDAFRQLVTTSLPDWGNAESRRRARPSLGRRISPFHRSSAHAGAGPRTVPDHPYARHDGSGHRP